MAHLLDLCARGDHRLNGNKRLTLNGDKRSVGVRIRSAIRLSHVTFIYA